MYCQNCRTPIRDDGSIGNLNPAAFDVLVGEPLPYPLRLHPKLRDFQAQRANHYSMALVSRA